MKQLSDNKFVNIDGYLFATYESRKVEDGQSVKPFLLDLEGIKFLPVFSTEEKLIEALERVGLGDVKLEIKRIDCGTLFLESVAGLVRVMVDPWITPEGNTRFVEVKLPG
jgi:hypothetical protein